MSCFPSIRSAFDYLFSEFDCPDLFRVFQRSDGFFLVHVDDVSDFVDECDYLSLSFVEVN